MSQYLLSIMKGHRRGLIARLIIVLLWPWSLVYRLGVFCHRNFYRLKGRYHSPKPFISIGNITVGGAGKTPLVIWLAGHLQYHGLKPVILLRGYMSEKGQPSDEADMLNDQLPYVPVLVGADRISNIRQAAGRLPVDVFIGDDAFQHWPLARCLDIVALDACNPFGNGCLLPAGILREPVSALRRADIIVLTKADGAPGLEGLRHRLQKLNPQALLVESCHRLASPVNVFSGHSMPLGILKDVPVIAFCAVGDPDSFRAGLVNSGARIVKMFTFKDHHTFTKRDVLKLLTCGREQAVDIFVATHKDAVKLRSFEKEFSGTSLLYVPVQLEMTKGSDEFFTRIMSACRD